MIFVQFAQCEYHGCEAKRTLLYTLLIRRESIDVLFFMYEHSVNFILNMARSVSCQSGRH